MSSVTRKLTLIAAILSGLVILAGCGNDDDPVPVASDPIMCEDLSLNVANVIATNISCPEATELLKTELGPITRRFTLGKFDCERSSGSKYSGDWTCKSGEREISFAFAD